MRKMHLKNDNEMNSNANIGTRLDVKPIAVKPLPSAISATSARDEATITPSTSSAGSCASSTDSGVIITDNNRRICDNNHNKSSQHKNVDTDRDNLNCNATSGNITIDNSNNNIVNGYGDERRRSVESLKANKNITINTQIDKNSINIENVINVRRHRSSSGSKASSKNGSPAVSIRSNTISIISIDENAIDSSVVDSDSDFEGQHSGYVVKKLGQQTTYEPNHPNLPNINKGMQVLSQTISPGAIPPTAGPLSETILNGGVLATPVLGPPMPPSSAQIGSIALSNSTDVTFGDKHFYEGPVTIQQFLIDSRDKWKNGEEGNDNPAFTGDPENAEKSKDSSTPPETSYIFNFRRRAVIITGAVILLMILVGIAIVTANAFTKQTNRKSKLVGDGDDSRKHIPINSTIAPRPDIGNGTLWVMSKDEWNGEAEHDDVSELKLPVPRVIIAHTASTSCANKLQCDARVLSVQAFHIHSNGWGDIGYNFLVGGDGLVYEGRGWYKQGAHTLGYNKDSICIAFIGTFNVELPTANDLKAAQLLIDEGVKLGVLTEDYRLYGARQLSATESPGKALYSIIMKWPHYRDDNVGGGKILRIVPRDAWLAQPPSGDPLPLTTPIKKIIVLPTRTDDCETQAMCVYRVRMTQTLNIESQNHDDIIYNFLIGGDGNVYEGRGWDVIGAHLRGFNSDSISFAYIGTFKKQKPSEKQMDATKLLLAEGVRLGKLSQDYKIYGAFMLDPTSTDVKSDELYNSFKDWPHWSEYKSN